jgi:hypothetical protein
MYRDILRRIGKMPDLRDAIVVLLTIIRPITQRMALRKMLSHSD